MPGPGNAHRHRRGFSLLELSIVLGIIGVLVAGTAVIGLAGLETKRFNTTVARMDRIHKALKDYAVVTNRLPCPASLTLATTNANYGVEAASNSNTCIGGTPAASFSSSGGAAEGAVPVRTLQLPDEYLYDAWGRKFRYAVNPAKTAASSFPPASGTQCTSTSALTVKDAAASDRTTQGAYVLMSHGANGHGGYTRAGTAYNAGSTNTDEQTNCHCNASAASTTYNATYVAKLPTENSSTATDKFDDIVSFRDAGQLQSPNEAMASGGACGFFIYVGEWDGQRVQKFTSDGVYVGQVNIGYSVNRLATDSSGNVYVSYWGSPWGGHQILKYDGDLNPIGALGNTSSENENGEFWYPNGLYIDSSDNLWVSDSGNNRIQKFNSSGTWLLSIGGPAPYTCTTSPATSQPACAAGYGDGQFVGDAGSNPLPKYIGADGNINIYSNISYIQKFSSSGAYISKTSYCQGGSGDGCFGSGGVACMVPSIDGNVWLCDPGNYRVQKFTPSLTYLSQFGSNGSGNGQFNNIWTMDLAVDASGNLYVTDYANNRVQKFDSSGTFVSKFGTYGSGNGQFNGPGAIAITSR